MNGRRPKIRPSLSLEQYLAENGDAAMQARTSAFKHSGSKSIADAVMVPEVRAALIDLANLTPNVDWVLIGGLALGAHAQPRSTQDVDVLVISEEDVSSLMDKVSAKFKKYTRHALEHRRTGVTLEIVTPDSIEVSSKLIQGVMKSAEEHTVDGRKIRVVTASGLIALKLQRAIKKPNSTLGIQDQVDIRNVLKANGYQDLTDLELNDASRKMYDDLWTAVQEEDREP